MLLRLIHTHFPLIFESPGFRWVWLANLVSKLGDWLGFIALNLYVFDLTGSATALAGLLAVESIPALLIGPLAGVVIDRFSRRKVMILANLGAALTFALLPLASALWQIYGLALLSRVAFSFFDPAERSLVPDLVGKEKVLAANSALSVVNHLTLIVGPAIAGFLVAASSAAVAFWADAASFVVAVLLISRIGGELPRTRPEGEVKPGWFDDLKFGLGYAFGSRALRVLLVTTFVAAFAGAALITIEVVYVKEVLDGGDVGYGLLYSIAGFGAILGSTNATRLSQRFTVPGLYVATVLLTGLMFFPYANVQILWFVIIVAGLHTIPWVLGYILVDTMLQQWVADEVRGRIFGLIHTQRSAGQVLVAGMLAPLVDWWGPVTVLNLSGIVYTLVGLYAVSRLGVLRREEARWRGDDPLPLSSESAL
ncbi:MAG: MFS transporter [Anaerolineae bacterium]|nr:MFS transporter [Anaerolineae bacterium]